MLDIIGAFALGCLCLAYTAKKVLDAMSPWKDERIIIKRRHRDAY